MAGKPSTRDDPKDAALLALFRAIVARDAGKARRLLAASPTPGTASAGVGATRTTYHVGQRLSEEDGDLVALPGLVGHGREV